MNGMNEINSTLVSWQAGRTVAATSDLIPPGGF